MLGGTSTLAALPGILKKLLDKRDAIRCDEIMSAVVKSKKSYDEILLFLEEDSQESNFDEEIASV